AIGHAPEHEHARGLRHGLHDQHAGHHRKIGKMALEKRLVIGDVLDADYALRLQLDDAIHQQERVAMRQYPADLVDVQDWLETRYYNSRGFLTRARTVETERDH